jgi:zinc transport system substrate-binding protein
MRRALLPLLLLVTACSSGGSGNDSGAPQVAVGAYPFSYLAREVGGENVSVVDLAKPGVEPHDVELGPREVARLQAADLVVGLRGFQPALEDALTSAEQLYDLGPVVGQQPATSDLGDEEGGLDPHVWLDPSRMATAATALGARLAELAPDAAQDIRARAATTAQQLTALDQDFRTGLQTCARRDLVTAHTAFAYLAGRYDLRQVGVSGLSPDSEPSPGRLAEVARYAQASGVTTVFFEAAADPGVARTLANEVGARTGVLDPLETVAPGDDYVTVMRRNLDALRTGLGCT